MKLSRNAKIKSLITIIQQKGNCRGIVCRECHFKNRPSGQKCFTLGEAREQLGKMKVRKWEIADILLQEN